MSASVDVSVSVDVSASVDVSVDSECFCRQCGNAIPTRRSMLGYATCMECGEADAVKARLSWCVVPMPKSNYILVTDPTLLLGLNSSHKGGMK